MSCLIDIERKEGISNIIVDSKRTIGNNLSCKLHLKHWTIYSLFLGVTVNGAGTIDKGHNLQKFAIN